MNAHQECSEANQLVALVEGKLSAEEQSSLRTHLDHCSRCQHSLEALTGQANLHEPARSEALDGAITDSQSKAQRKASPPGDNPDATQSDVNLRASLAKEKNGQLSITQAHTEELFTDELPLDFLTPTDKPGHLGRLGSFEVIEVIGRGGMGIVLKAFDPSLHRFVAIKVLAPQLATSGAARKRFAREARAAATVMHEHVVAIHAVDTSGPLPYLVMHYVAGKSLQERLDQSGPLEVEDILRIGMQTAAGLAAAHAHGLIHRDVKPANILLEDSVERVKLTDFGLARAVDDASVTNSGVVAGTPQYMAPEQARGEALDHRADLFSLGSVLYALCTGRPPFRADNAMAVLKRVSEDTPRPIQEINPRIPDWLAAVVARLQAKDPADRFQSAAEVAETLRQQLTRLQNPGSVEAPLRVQPASVPAPGVPVAPTSRRWAIAAVLLLAVLGLSGAFFGPGAYRWLTDRDRPSPDNRGPKPTPPEPDEAGAVTVNIRIRKAKYEALVEPDGYMTSLRVGGVEFLKPGVNLSRGCYFVMWDKGLRPTLSVFEGPSSNVFIARGKEAAIRYEFGDDTIALKATNATEKEMQFFMVLDPHVKAVTNGQGR